MLPIYIILAKILAICIRIFIQECKVFSSFTLSECRKKAPIYLVITLVTNLPTQNVGLIPWIHEEYLLTILSKMMFPSRGISCESSFTLLLFVIIYGQLLYCMFPIKGKVVCFSSSETALYVNKVFMPSINSLWTCVQLLRNSILLKIILGIFLYKILCNIPVEIRQRLDFKLPLKWMYIQL